MNAIQSAKLTMKEISREIESSKIIDLLQDAENTIEELIGEVEEKDKKIEDLEQEVADLKSDLEDAIRSAD